MNKAKQNNSGGGASSGRLIQIELPLEGTNTKLNINPTTTAQQVHDIIINRPFYKNTAYAFSLAPSDSRKTALQPNTQLAKQQTSCFTFIITGISATVRMEHKGTDETFQFGSDYTVKECLLFIEHCDCFGSSYASSNLKGENFSSLHELYLVKEALSLPHAYSCADGIKMQNDKLLSSYRLKHGDCLVFARSKKIPNFWSTPPSGNISILITEPETKKSQTMSFPPTTSYFEVIGQFLERVGIKESRWFYGMYVELDNNSPKYYLHREWTLQTFHLPSPARLECRKKKLPKREWFGVDPDSVPLMKDPDNGIKVPQVLLILKDLLQILDGPASEGIFRKAGLQSEMEKIRQQFLDGLPFECYNQHSIATLLKRWYKAIPTRLLEGINREDDSDEFALKYPTYLSKTETRLMSWLLDLLLDVVTHEATNLMDAKNLAIVWGPGMTGSSEESNTAPSPMDITGFSDTRFGINFIQVNVAHFQETGTKPYGACDGSSNGATAKCIVDHSKRAPGELELKVGDIVTIVDNTTQDWAFVSQNGKYGFVAKGFISVQNSAEASEPVVNS